MTELKNMKASSEISILNSLIRLLSAKIVKIIVAKTGHFHNNPHNKLSIADIFL
jgi:hypothetical protein